MKNKSVLVFGSILLMGILFSLSFVVAESDHNIIFEEAKALINGQITCSELSEVQFEVLGEYYMELMAPGELHEIIDARMGGEGSESLRLAHVNIGRMQYCGEYAGMSGVGFMMGGSGMYGSSDFGMYGDLDSDSNYGWMDAGMYGKTGKSYVVFGWIVGLLVIIALVLLIVLLYKKVRGGK